VPAVSTVLMIQADAALRQQWTAELESHGLVVLAAWAARDGILRVREGGVDVIVIDTSPEGLSEFVAELVKLPDAPPFVMASGSPAAPEISARLGAAAFVPRPCNAADVSAVILQIVRYAASADDEPTNPRRGSL
jgi:DNA-binding response OmpR family regulator